MADRYEGIDRRKTPEDHPLINYFDRRLNSLRDEIREDLKEAFPDGDLVKHRLNHESSIKSSEAWAKLKMSLVEALIKAGVLAAAGLLLSFFWDSFKEFLRHLVK